MAASPTIRGNKTIIDKKYIYTYPNLTLSQKTDINVEKGEA